MVPVDRGGQGPAASASGHRLRKPPQEEEGDGLPLSDEVLLLIITRVAGDTADLVRCAATCRRWRRLVSAEADFICLHAPPRTDRSARGLALGFFHHPDKTQPPRFVPLPSASSSSRLPSLKHLVDGEGRRIFHDASSSRVVACRDGRLVVEILRPTNGGPLTLCVCNPASGEADVLPCLPGGESYGCALLTVDDLRYYKDKDNPPPRSASSYRVVLVFDHDGGGGYTAARCFCSDAGRWGPAARVIGGRIADAEWRRRWPQKAAVVHRGVVFWPRLTLALLALPTVDATAVPGVSTNTCYWRLVGSTPDGKLRLATTDGVDGMFVYYRDHLLSQDVIGPFGSGGTCWRYEAKTRLPNVLPPPPVRPGKTRLWWLCEQSGLIFFTACRSGEGGGHLADDVEECCYAFSIDARKVDKVASNGGKPWEGVYGYEMDRVTFLSSLAGGKTCHTTA